MCMGNFSKDFSFDNVRNTAFYQYIYNFLLLTTIISILPILKTFRSVWWKKYKIGYMSGFINQTFIILVMVILCFLGSLAAIKAVTGAKKMCFMINQQCMARAKLIDLILDQLAQCYTFMICISRCNGSCNTLKEQFGRIFLSNKVEDIFKSLKVRDKWVKSSCKTYLMWL